MHTAPTLAPPAADQARPHLPTPGTLLPAISLCRRELVRFLRQRHRIVGALATPIVFWLLIGGGLAGSFTGGRGESYIQFFFPGTLVMILLFTAIFSTISIIEDRREGFLQSVLIAPIPRRAVVLGKVLGAAALATGQGIVFLLLAPLVGIGLSILTVALTVLLMFIVSFALSSLGFAIAWRMNSSQGFHAIMNLFLMPMWFLSGALFPVAGAWWGLRWVMRANPLTYGLEGIRQALWFGRGGGHIAVPLLVSCAFALGLFIIAQAVAQRTVAGDLQ